MQVVHFHQRNSSGDAYPAYDGGVVTRWQVCDNRRFPRIPRSVTAVLNLLDLIAGDDPADDRSPPIVVRGNQSPIAIVQFQCWISHCVWNSELAEFRPNRAQNHPLSLSPSYNKTTNHHVIARLNKTAGTEIAQI